MRVQDAAIALREWYLHARPAFGPNRTWVPFAEADTLLAKIGSEPLRTLVVTWYNVRAQHAEMVQDVDLYKGAILPAQAKWRQAEPLLERVLWRLVAARRLAITPLDRLRIRRMWKRAARPKGGFEAD
jgi:hypothetical protein